jgi:hypothetical protein
LINERDDEVREVAISTIEKSVKYHKPPGSKTKKKITGKDIVKELIVNHDFNNYISSAVYIISTLR